MRSNQTLTLGILFTLLLGACSQGSTATENPQVAEQPSLAASASPTTSFTAPAITSQPVLKADEPRTFRILPEASRASYQVQEKFFDRPLPNQAVGTTQDVEGEIQVNLGDGLSEVSTRVSVDLETIRSDAPPRDGAMREWLATELHPTAIFTSTAATDLSSSYTEGEEIRFGLSGDLSLRGVTRPTIFDVRGRLQGDTVTGSASTVISMEDFHIPAESFFGLSIDDAVTIRLDFTAVDTNSSEKASSAEVPKFADPTPETAMIQGIDDRLGSQELIAFISQRDGNDEIYLMNADGSGLSRLTDTPAYESAPHWSADGALLSFVSAESMFEGKQEFHISRPPSWEPQEISRAIFFEGAPALSPDGTRLAYVMDGNIYVASTSMAETEPVQLTKSPVYDASPVWSPDGRRIAYLNGNERMRIFIVDVPDTPGSEVPEPVEVASRPSFYGIPAWSPDGRKIAYESGEFNSDIYVSTTTGSEIVQLTDAASYDGFPVWSPRGDKVLFRSYRDGNSEVYVMNLDGSEAVNLSNHPASDEAPTWSPDGTRIAFASDRDGKYQIYAMNVDGTDVTRLTEDSAGAGGPVWQPQTR